MDNATLDGGSGNDTLVATGTNVWLSFGSAGAGVTVDLQAGTALHDGYTDSLSGTFSALTGTDYNDSVVGSGTARIFGMAGNDTLVANGSNALYGGSGNDNLVANGDNATLDGGSGNNTLVSSGNHDWLSYQSATSGVAIDLSAGTVYGASNQDSIGGSFMGVVGSQFDDTITGAANTATIDGGAGNDSIVAGSGTQSIMGGDGDDVIALTQLGSTTIDGGAGNDRVQLQSAGTVSISDIAAALKKVEVLDFGSATAALNVGTLADDQSNKSSLESDLVAQIRAITGVGGNSSAALDIYTKADFATELGKLADSQSVNGDAITFTFHDQANHTATITQHLQQ
jgi:Ca2+-binding RTX toxin-like protein